MAGKRRAPGPAVKRTTGKQPVQTPKTGRDRLKFALKWGGIGTLVLLVLAVTSFVILYKAIDIPDPNEDFLTQTTYVYYDDGKTQVGSFATQQRESIDDYEDIPANVRDAVVAAEDQSFWTNSGIDVKGILRAAFSNARGNAKQGASTITQQYVKILYLTQERSYKRKIKEAIISLKIHNQLSKEEILKGYLNTIYFGRGAYGIQAAAHAYFDKSAKQLNLRESAALAAILNSPTTFDPANGKESRERLAGRFDYVLKNMAEMDTITAEQAAHASQRLPKFPHVRAESTYSGQRGHMLSLIKQELLRLKFTEDQINGGGLRVYTTFDKKAMDADKNAVQTVKPDVKDLHVAVASVEPGTGALRGFYAGQDYLKSQINWAVSGGLPGSAFKPFALATGLEAGFSLKDRFAGNSPYYYNGEGTGDFIRNEADTDYGEQVDLITATEQSINTAFADLTMSIPDGPDEILDTATEMGIPKWDKHASGLNHLRTSPGLEPIASIALGSATVAPINMANAYATIANGGERADVYMIEKVEDRNGEVLYRHRVHTREAIDEDVSRDVSYALQQVVLHGTGANAQGLGRPAAGKTGTATNAEDQVSSSWFVGFTPQMSTAVMYVRGTGNESLEGYLVPFFGATYPTLTWTAAMRGILEGEPIESFPPPAFVDGEAPDEGHQPFTPQPKPTKTTRSPTQVPTTSAPPTTIAPTTSSPSTSTSTGVNCTLFPNNPNCQQTTSPTPTDTTSASPTHGNGGGGGGGGSTGGAVFPRSVYYREEPALP